MGGCCSHDVALRGGGRVETEVNDGEYEYDDSEDNNINNNDAVTYQNDGAMVRLRGFSKLVSMYTQQGMKGVNQDSMTVWEVIIIKIILILLFSFFILFMICLFPLILMNFCFWLVFLIFQSILVGC